MEFSELNNFIKDNVVLGINKADAYDVDETISTKVVKTANNVLNAQRFKLDGKEVALVYLNTELSDRVKFIVGKNTYKAGQSIDVAITLSSRGKKQFTVVE